METFLLTWNKDKSRWVSFDADYALIKERHHHILERSCGNSGRLLRGSRVFLVKQGREPTGIVGAGIVISERPVSKPYWNDAHKTANYVEILFDTLLHPDREPILRRSELTSESLRKATNATQSGPRLKPEDAKLLEFLWAPFARRAPEATPHQCAEEVLQPELFWEGALHHITVNTYERDPKARQACIDHFGAVCSVCGFEFHRVYGELGRGYIHVHHIRPLSEIGESYAVDPQKDLTPVCPNCHAMLHLPPIPLSVEELKALLQSRDAK